MSSWVGFLVYTGNKVEMVFTSVVLDERAGIFRATGSDIYGDFNIEGTIQDKHFNAIKHYPTWNIYYKGEYEQDKPEIYGCWGYNEDEFGETFKIMKIRNEKVMEFRQTLNRNITE